MLIQLQKSSTPAGVAGTPDSQAGMLLLELSIAIPVMLIGALGVVYAMQSNYKSTRMVINEDLAAAEFNNAIETITSATFEDIYATYSGGTLYSLNGYVYSPTGSTNVNQLEDPTTGGAPQISVTFHLDETTLPSEFGPLVDIDGDGALNTTDCSSTYRLLPTQLTLTYRSGDNTVTRQMFVLLGPEI
jgi:type II secretory pathway pseudopilin PulG